MRKGLIATAVAVALFAVGAFAASFAVSSEDTASGSNAVKRCADNVVIEFNELYSTTTKNWYVDNVDLTLEGTNLAACLAKAEAERATVTLVLQNNANPQIKVYEATTPLSSGSLTFGAAAADILAGGVDIGAGVIKLPVSQVWNAAVLIDGIQISAS
jgi:ABC-type phosphate transport system substrate-binding protein